MLLIPAWIMKVHLAMLNYWVVPVSHINGTIWAHGNIYWTERNVVYPQQDFGKLGRKTTSLFLYCKSVDSIGAEVIGDKTDLPISHMTPGDDVQTTVLRLSRIQ